MRIDEIKRYCKFPGLVCGLVLWCLSAFAQSDSDFPAEPNPPRLVNDLAHVLSEEQAQALEEKLVAYNDSTSSPITIVTVQSIGGYDIAQYATELGNRWKVWDKKKYNGVVILAAIKDHKVNISPGRGLEGALPDALCGRIIREEIVPAFKDGDYYEGFNKGTDALILAARGEYTADEKQPAGDKGGGGLAIVLIVIVVVYLFIRFIGRGGGGGGGGNYMSRRGGSSFGGSLLGALIGSSLGRGGGGWGGGGNSGWGGGSSGGGGFGGFGGSGSGGFGGGGASGSW